MLKTLNLTTEQLNQNQNISPKSNTKSSGFSINDLLNNSKNSNHPGEAGSSSQAHANAPGHLMDESNDEIDILGGKEEGSSTTVSSTDKSSMSKNSSNKVKHDS